jgi:hypothetical protein
MGFEILIERGVRVLCEERAGELRELLGDEHKARAAEDALAFLPRVLTALNEIAWNESASVSARALLSVVMGYGLKTGNLIPAEGNRILLGVLDDAYIAFYAADQVAALLPAVGVDGLRRHLAALKKALPGDIVAELERMVDMTLAEVAAASRAP